MLSDSEFDQEVQGRLEVVTRTRLADFDLDADGELQPDELDLLERMIRAEVRTEAAGWIPLASPSRPALELGDNLRLVGLLGAGGQATT